LKESEIKYRLLYETSRDAIMTLAPPSWRFTAGNPATIEMFHAKDEEEFVSKEPWELSPKYQPDGELSSLKAQRMIQNAMETGSNFFEWTHNRIKGDNFPATVLLTRIELKGKQLLQATVRDVTEQKKNEEELRNNRLNLEELVAERTKALRESEKKFKAFTNQSTEGITVADLEGNYVFVNPAFCKMSGYTKQELLQMTIFDMKAKDQDPSGFSESIGALEGVRHIVKLRRKDKTEYLTEITGKVISLDKEKLALGTIRDITERQKSEVALRKSEEQYRLLFNFLPYGGEVLDTQGIIVNCSPSTAKMLGYEVSELIGKPLIKLLTPDSVKIFQQDLPAVLNGNPVSGEISMLKKDGSELNLLRAVEPIMSKDGELESILAINVDISERKKAEQVIIISRERLKMANKIVRHDLTNDLNVINSAINIFKHTSDPAMIEEIKKRVKKSIRAIDNYKKYEQFIDSRSDLKEIELNRLITKISEEYPGVKINIEGNGYVLADEALNSVFNNLISNSIKHGNSSQINIKILEKKEICLIELKDNGNGIPDKIKDNIFEEGFKYGEKGNTGIGLHIVKTAIERYGGTITVDDNKPQGANFTIKLKKVIGQ